MVCIDNYGNLVTYDDGFSTYELYHHGILGQKHGVRNGPPYPLAENVHSASEKKAGWKKSLSEAARDVTTGNTGTASRLVASVVTGRGLMGMLTSKRHREKRANKLEEKAKKAAAKGKTKKAEKLERKASAQKQKNKDMEAYLKKTSTAKLAVQEVLLRGIAIDNYRAARARGAGRVRAVLEANAARLPIGTILRVVGDKKKYGAITHSGM